MTSYQVMFYAGLILAILFLIAAIIVFFVMKIPEALGVVTGSTRRKEIAEINAGGKGKAVQKDRRKIEVHDAKIENKSETDPEKPQSFASTLKMGTDTGRRTERTPDADSEKTEVLRFRNDSMDDRQSTEILSEDEVDTAVLSDGSGQNSSNSDEDAQTAVLQEETTTVLSTGDSGDQATTILRGNQKKSVGEDSPTEILNTDRMEQHIGDIHTYGSTDPNLTSVLTSPSNPNTNSSKRVSEIRVLYKKTITHTEESL